MDIVLAVLACLAVTAAVGALVGKIFGAEVGFIASGVLGILLAAGAVQAAQGLYPT